MTKNQLKQEIQQHIRSEIPNVLSKISVQSIAIEPKEIQQVEYAKKPKRLLSLRLATSLAVVAVLFTIVFSQTVYSPSYLGDAKPLETNEEILTFSTISATALLDSFESGGLEGMSFRTLSTTSLKIEDELKQVNAYLEMVERITGDRDHIQITVHETSDVDGYAIQISYQSVDLLGNEQNYTIYYNETLISNSKTEFAGVMVMNDQVYFLEGTSTSIGAITRVELIASLEDSVTDYVRVVQTTTKTIQSYQFEVVENSQVKHRSSIVLQSVDNRMRANVTFEEVGKKSTYNILRVVEDQVEMILLNYTIVEDKKIEAGAARIRVEMNEETEEYEYRYKIQSNSVIREGAMGRINKSPANNTPPGLDNIPINPGRHNNPGRPGRDQSYELIPSSSDWVISI